MEPNQKLMEQFVMILSNNDFNLYQKGQTHETARIHKRKNP